MFSCIISLKSSNHLQSSQLMWRMLRKKSAPRSLDPILVDGLLRVGGRLGLAPISFDSKHQIILPKSDHVSTLIIKHCHLVSGHSGREYVLRLLRENFWIVKASSAIRRVLSKCISCRRRQRPVCEQKMAYPRSATLYISRCRLLWSLSSKAWTKSCKEIRSYFHVFGHSCSTYLSLAQFGHRFLSVGTEKVHSEKRPSQRDPFR